MVYDLHDFDTMDTDAMSIYVANIYSHIIEIFQAILWDNQSDDLMKYDKRSEIALVLLKDHWYNRFSVFEKFHLEKV